MSQTDLVTYECPIHKLCSLVVEVVSGSGVRVAGPKCCVNQYQSEVLRWHLTKNQWLELAREAENAAEDVAS